MPTGQRQPITPTEEWRRIAALAAWPEQRAYEELRPVVLFGRPVAERAGETGTAERTLYRRVARFDAAGLASLFPPPKVEKHRRLPERIRRLCWLPWPSVPTHAPLWIRYPAASLAWARAAYLPPWRRRRSGC
jgi:hypothetical protein